MHHLQTLLVFLFEDIITFLFMLSIVQSYRIPNFPTLDSWHVFVPYLLYSSPQSSGTTISNTLFNSYIFNFWSLFVVVVKLGDEFIQTSHGLQFESRSTSNPYISKQCLSFIITDWTLFKDMIIKLWMSYMHF